MFLLSRRCLAFADGNVPTIPDILSLYELPNNRNLEGELKRVATGPGCWIDLSTKHEYPIKSIGRPRSKSMLQQQNEKQTALNNNFLS